MPAAKQAVSLQFPEQEIPCSSCKQTYRACDAASISHSNAKCPHCYTYTTINGSFNSYNNTTPPTVPIITQGTKKYGYWWREPAVKVSEHSYQSVGVGGPDDWGPITRYPMGRFSVDSFDREPECLYCRAYQPHTDDGHRVSIAATRKLATAETKLAERNATATVKPYRAVVTTRRNDAAFMRELIGEFVTKGEAAKALVKYVANWRRTRGNTAPKWRQCEYELKYDYSKRVHGWLWIEKVS